jgi:hypothetical protein
VPVKWCQNSSPSSNLLELAGTCFKKMVQSLEIRYRAEHGCRT